MTAQLLIERKAVKKKQETKGQQNHHFHSHMSNISNRDFQVQNTLKKTCIELKFFAETEPRGSENTIVAYVKKKEKIVEFI